MTSSLSGVNSRLFTFNQDDGNVTATGGKTFSYDTENHLVSMNGGAVRIAHIPAHSWDAPGLGRLEMVQLPPLCDGSRRNSEDRITMDSGAPRRTVAGGVRDEETELTEIGRFPGLQKKETWGTRVQWRIDIMRDPGHPL